MPCQRNIGLNRRWFLETTAFSTAVLSTNHAFSLEPTSVQPIERIDKHPAVVRVAFLYPPLNLVEAGKIEDNWAVHNWATWPGNQFNPEEQQKRFSGKIAEMAAKIGVKIEWTSDPLYTSAAVTQFTHSVNESKPDALLLINFWNTFSQWTYQITQDVTMPSIVYHSVGSNHQLPPKDLMQAEGVYYIHSIENWEEIERGLRAVHAKTQLQQSRLVRIGSYPEMSESVDPGLGFKVVNVPAEVYNNLFDSIPADTMIREQAEDFSAKATEIRDITERYLADAFRAHETVRRIREQFAADAITIRCLMLEQRKPCISFSINNGELNPCGCEDDFNATQTLMLGRWILERGGFQHNPEFDTSRNQYFAAHCTCATKLLGPHGPEQSFWIRPFFHQLPKTPALDVQWESGAEVFLTKYDSKTIHVWTGTVVQSPTSPPTGGCATRVLINFDRVEDVCSIYPGPHPVLYRGTPGEAKRLKAFAKLYRIPLTGNV